MGDRGAVSVIVGDLGDWGSGGFGVHGVILVLKHHRESVW
jgi:hypothetical protein